MNYLEQLAFEYYEYLGFIVERNVRLKNGIRGELDIIGYNPKTNQVIHVEAYTDSKGKSDISNKLKEKFEKGDKYILEKYHGINKHEKIVLSLNKHICGPTDLVDCNYISFESIISVFHGIVKNPVSSAIDEKYPILRTVQLMKYLTKINNS